MIDDLFPNLPYDTEVTSLQGPPKEYAKKASRIAMRYASLAGLALTIAIAVI